MAAPELMCQFNGRGLCRVVVTECFQMIRLHFVQSHLEWVYMLLHQSARLFKDHAQDPRHCHGLKRARDPIS